jgi:hypothetical protein
MSLELTKTVKHLAAAPANDRKTVIKDNYPVVLFQKFNQIYGSLANATKIEF